MIEQNLTCSLANGFSPVQWLRGRTIADSVLICRGPNLVATTLLIMLNVKNALNAVAAWLMTMFLMMLM